MQKGNVKGKEGHPYLFIKMLIHLNDLPIQEALVLFALFVLIPHFRRHTES